MVRAGVAGVVVVMVRAPVGRGVAGWCGNAQLTTPPRLAWILSGATRGRRRRCAPAWRTGQRPREWVRNVPSWCDNGSLAHRPSSERKGDLMRRSFIALLLGSAGPAMSQKRLLAL